MFWVHIMMKSNLHILWIGTAATTSEITCYTKNYGMWHLYVVQLYSVVWGDEKQWNLPENIQQMQCKLEKCKLPPVYIETWMNEWMNEQLHIYTFTRFIMLCATYFCYFLRQQHKFFIYENYTLNVENECSVVILLEMFIPCFKWNENTSLTFIFWHLICNYIWFYSISKAMDIKIWNS